MRIPTCICVHTMSVIDPRPIWLRFRPLIGNPWVLLLGIAVFSVVTCILFADPLTLRYTTRPINIEFAGINSGTKIPIELYVGTSLLSTVTIEMDDGVPINGTQLFDLGAACKQNENPVDGGRMAAGVIVAVVLAVLVLWSAVLYLTRWISARADDWVLDAQKLIQSKGDRGSEQIRITLFDFNKISWWVHELSDREDTLCIHVIPDYDNGAIDDFELHILEWYPKNEAAHKSAPTSIDTSCNDKNGENHIVHGRLPAADTRPWGYVRDGFIRKVCKYVPAVGLVLFVVSTYILAQYASQKPDSYIVPSNVDAIAKAPQSDHCWVMTLDTPGTITLCTQQHNVSMAMHAPLNNWCSGVPEIYPLHGWKCGLAITGMAVGVVMIIVSFLMATECETQDTRVDDGVGVIQTTIESIGSTGVCIVHVDNVGRCRFAQWMTEIRSRFPMLHICTSVYECKNRGMMVKWRPDPNHINIHGCCGL